MNHGGQRSRGGLPAAHRMAGPLLVFEGAVLLALSVWHAVDWLPRLSSPALVVVIAAAAVMLAGVAVLAMVVAGWGAAMILRRRPAAVHGFALQPVVLAVLYLFSLLDSAPWLFWCGAALAAATLVSLRS